MPTDYSVLASVYDAIGLGDFARNATPRLLDFALRNDWLGRQITDLGCGTGAGLPWLARHNYVVAAIDNSPEMLARARASLGTQGLQATWIQEDIRTLNRPDSMDMAIALNVLIELDTIQEWEMVLKGVHDMLRAGKWFIFDLDTIEGLVGMNVGDMLIHDSPKLTVMAQNQFDYDRAMLTRHYLIFSKTDQGWEKRETVRVLRSYAVQAIMGLAKRIGFNVLYVLNPDLSRYEPGKTGIQRVIIVAQKR
jgi:SAM-dependent methyltransferase